jgi:hypothetical protein
MVPSASMAFGPLDLWPDVQRRLADAGMLEAVGSPNPGYCALGATTDVPVIDDAASSPQQ